MKKIINILGIGALTIFSFYYTNKMIDIAKSKDPIMIEIVKQKDNYVSKAVNAQITYNYIIPGISGTEIDVNKSYYKMKQLGEYNDNLYVFKETLPVISIKDNYDKFIISGNPNKNKIAIIVKIEKEEDLTYINKLLSILEENLVTINFFIDGSVVENNVEILEKIVLNNNYLGNLGYDNKYNRLTIKYTNSLIEKFTNYENNSCLVENDEMEVLELCSKLKMFTIKGNVINKNNIYSDMKKKLANGGIYIIDLDKSSLSDFNVAIKYIKYKGYEMVTINELISEEKD